MHSYLITSSQNVSEQRQGNSPHLHICHPQIAPHERREAHGGNEFDMLPFVEMLEGVENSSSATCIQKKPNGEFEPISYQCATKKFYDRTRILPESSQRLERNRIQERILAISEDRCNAYKRYLRYDQSMSNFWLGFGSTLAGGFGALSNSLQEFVSACIC